MKKLLRFIGATLMALALGGSVLASCEEIDFGNDSVCVDIIQVDNDVFELDIDSNGYNGYNYATNAYYYVLLPNKKENRRSSGGGLLSPRLGYYGGDFEYDYRDYDGYDSAIRPVKIYAIIDNEVEGIQMYYDFEEGDRANPDDSYSYSSNNGDLDDFDFSYVEDDSPDKDEWVTIRVKALDDNNDLIDDYDDRVTIKFERDGDDADRYDLKIKSDDFNDDEYDLSNGELDVDFDNGYLEFDARFKYEDDYTIAIEDGSIDADQEFNVGGSSSSNNGDLDNFYIYLSDNTPEEDDEVTLYISARDEDNYVASDYEGSNADVTIEYRTSSSSSRRNATSSYISIDDDTPYFDNGVADTDITFKHEYEYRITVEDDDENVEDNRRFDVGGSSSSSNSDLDNFYIYLSDNTPARNDDVILRIKARDNDNDTLSDYRGSNADVMIEYRTSPSSSRRDATSSYVSIDDDTPYFSNGIAETIVTFKYEYEYRITVEDDDENIEDDETFDVGGNSSSNYDADNFYITTDDSTPKTNRSVDLRIKARDGTSTDTEYRGEVEFTIYYRTSSSSSRRETSSSSYFEMDNDYEDGYEFTSSDDGYANLSDAIEFKKEYEYKVLVNDKDDDNIEGYKIFDLEDEESDVDGFSQDELDRLEGIYDSRINMINDLEDDYPNLDDNNDRKDMSDEMYDDMKDVLDDRSSRNFDDRDDFVDAFKERYEYTIDNR